MSCFLSGENEKKLAPLPPAAPPWAKTIDLLATSKTLYAAGAGMSKPSETRSPSRERTWQPTHCPAPAFGAFMNVSAFWPLTPNS